MRACIASCVSAASRIAPPTLSKNTLRPCGQWRFSALVVDRRVETEFIDEIAALFLAAGDADDATPLDLRDLSDDGTDGAGSTGHHDRVAGLGLADVEQAEIRGDTWHSQRRQVHRQGCKARVDALRAFAVRDRVILHAEHADDRVADLETGMLRSDHFACGAGAHDFADADRRDVGLAFVHPAAHRRIERDVAVAHQELALCGFARGLFGKLEIAVLGLAHRTCGETELTVLQGHCGDFLRSRPGQFSSKARRRSINKVVLHE
jgi:hypothetical protein